MKFLNLNDMTVNKQDKTMNGFVELSGIKSMEQDPDLYVIKAS